MNHDRDSFILLAGLEKKEGSALGAITNKLDQGAINETTFIHFKRVESRRFSFKSLLGLKENEASAPDAIVDDWTGVSGFL